MPTLEQQIAAKFLAALSATTGLDNEKVDRLRVLLASGKKLKTDELVKLFAEPSGGEVK